jgi:hypothetical protein
MANYQRPGVFVNEVLTVANPDQGQTADAAAAFIAECHRGPVVPTLVSSWSGFTSQFGDFSNSTYLAQAVYAYFQNGGSQAYISRVATSTQVTALRVLNDTGVTPVPTLQVSAFSAGVWGNQIFIDVTASFVTGRFNLVVYYGGTSATNVVETWSDLSMSPSDPRYAITTVNGSSLYVVLADQGSATVAPNNAPAVQSGVALASGADGVAPTAAEYLASAQLLTTLERVLVVNAPGVVDVTTLNNILGVATGIGTMFVVVDPPANSTVAGVASFAASLTPTSQAAVYYPWVVVSDPSRYTPGTKVAQPPGGSVVGQYLSNDAASGPFQTPAGVRARLQGVVDLQNKLSSSDYDSLNSGAVPVNGIKSVPGYGICIFGGRTIKNGYPDRYIAVRRSLMFIEQSSKNLTQFAIFEPNDYRLYTALTSVLSSFLNSYYAKGGLAGSSPGQAFYVKCDNTNNTASSIQSGVVNIEIGVALEYPAEFIVIRIGQFEGGSTISNSLAQ